MEKPGIRRGAIIGHGSLMSAARLCILSAFLSMTIGLCPALDADISITPDEVENGKPFVLRILVYPSEPADTSLGIEDLPGSFSSGASSKEKRMTEQSWVVGSGRMSATLFTHEWTPDEPGEYSLGPFVVRAGEEELRLPPVEVRVVRRSDGGKARLYWTLPDTRSGESGSADRRVLAPVSGTKVRLSLNATFSGSFLSVHCPAPEGGLLETVKIAETGLPVKEAETVQVAAFDWTPFEAGSRRLPDAVMEYTSVDGTERRISCEPRLVLVREGIVGKGANGDSPGKDAGSTVSKALAAAFDGPPTPAPPQDARTGRVAVPSSLDRDSSDIVFFGAREEWKAGRRGYSIARLRAAEYASFFPSRYRNARLEAEKSLGLERTPSVPRAAWKHPSVIASVLLLALALSSGFIRRGIRGLAVSCLCLSLMLAAFAGYIYIVDSKPAAVVVDGGLYHVPDASSRVVDTIPEGSVVVIYRGADGWVYVRTEKSLTGWMKDTQLVVYTKGDSTR